MRIWLLLICCCGVVSQALATDWPHFRGPFYNGSTDETNLPTDWSTTDNIAWTADLPGPSAATPVVSGSCVFVSSTDLASEGLQALCFDRSTGAQRWAHDIVDDDITEGLRRDTRSTYAAPSPAADGDVVVFFYGNGLLYAFDYDGNKLWNRNLQKEYGEFSSLWTFATSPLLYGGRLYVQILQRDVPVDGRGKQRAESYLLAIHPKTGLNSWRSLRPSQAVAESREGFTSPVPFAGKTGKELLVIGGDALTSHDLLTGEELWRWETWNPDKIGHWRHVPSPVASEEVVLVCAPKRDPVYAIKRGGTGQLTSSSVAWVSKEHKQVTSDVPTPAHYDGDFFILSDVAKSLTRVSPSGDIKWTLSKTPGLKKYEASPLAADGKIYLINFAGEVTIVDAESGEILKTISMDANKEGDVRSTIVAAGGQLFIRANRKLYCVGEK